MEQYKVIFHINECSKWNTVLANVSNLIKDLGQVNVVIEVVANGAAVLKYVPMNVNGDNEFVTRISEASKVGVKFIACKNSLVGNKIEENVLPGFITVVSAGVTELIKKQAEGYAYIKP